MHSAISCIRKCARAMTLVQGNRRRENSVLVWAARSGEDWLLEVQLMRDLCHLFVGIIDPRCLSAVLQGNVNSWHCWDLLGRAFLIHPASSGFGSCVNSLLLTKACLSCTVRKESVRSWVRGRDEDEMWAARVDFWCTFDKCTFKSKKQWTQVLNSDPQPGLQVICISFGILQSLAKCHGSTSFLAASAKYIP